jgi:hypothetical protein
MAKKEFYNIGVINYIPSMTASSLKHRLILTPAYATAIYCTIYYNTPTYRHTGKLTKLKTQIPTYRETAIQQDLNTDIIEYRYTGTPIYRETSIIPSTIHTHRHTHMTVYWQSHIQTYLQTNMLSYTN